MVAMRQREASKEYMQLARRFPLVPIRNLNQFKRAIELVKELGLRSDLVEEEHGYFLVLCDLVEDYERKRILLGEETTPSEALKYLMEVNGLSQKDLVDLVGYKSHLSAFLNGKRGLSKAAAVRLGERFKVSPMLFLPKLTSQAKKRA